MHRSRLSLQLTLAGLLTVSASTLEAARETDQPNAIEADVCVYAATPSGILAAVAVKQRGRSVVVVEPSRWVGGILGAGLKPMQDCPNYAATGGMTRTLLQTLGQPRGTPGAKSTRELTPNDIRDDFRKLLDEHAIRVVYNHRIARCEKPSTDITVAVFDLAPYDSFGCPPAEPETRGSLRVKAKVFIDASYEGDFLARAGVSYRVGREAAAELDEPQAGVQPPQVLTPIDPFIEPGRPESGLLRWVEDDHGRPVGSADGHTQAYNYRYYTTTHPEHRVPIAPPDNYDPVHYELVGRYVAHLVATFDGKELRDRLVGIWPGWMNAGEWNYQRQTLFSMAPLGISHQYADGSHADRARVWKEHQEYLRGLAHFMRTDARVPESYRTEIAASGLDGRFHPETQGWPHQLYVRVARRLKGRYTITAHDVYNRTQVDDSVGLAQYGIDTYPSRRIWLRRDGRTWVGIEGNMFVGGSRGPTNVPYPVSYRAITPQAEDCTNLLVPVAFSATHLGYASARMEPVFMICGESAGIAACRAIEEATAVQDIDLPAYKEALEAAGQKLFWDPEHDRAASSGRPELTYARLLQECNAAGDGPVSQAQWNAGKPGWEWLFPFIDTDGDGTIDKPEYEAFQLFKVKHPDWHRTLREKAEAR